MIGVIRRSFVGLFALLLLPSAVFAQAHHLKEEIQAIKTIERNEKIPPEYKRKSESDVEGNSKAKRRSKKAIKLPAITLEVVQKKVEPSSDQKVEPSQAPLKQGSTDALNADGVGKGLPSNILRHR